MPGRPSSWKSSTKNRWHLFKRAARVTSCNLHRPFLDIKSIAKGRVWTGSDALLNGLADREGNLRDALDYAAELAELESYRLYELPAQKTEVERIMELFGTAQWAKSSSLLKTIQDHPALREVEYLLNTPGMQAKLNPIFSQF